MICKSWINNTGYNIQSQNLKKYLPFFIKLDFRNIGSTYLPIYKEKQLIKNLIEFQEGSCLNLLWNNRVWKKLTFYISKLDFKHYLLIPALLSNNSSEKTNKQSIISPTRFENLLTVLAYSPIGRKLIYKFTLN